MRPSGRVGTRKNAMKPLFRLVCLPMLACLFAVGVHAQNLPRIGYVYPAGGRQGSTVQVVLGGQYLDGVTNVVFSGSGVRATIVEHIKPLSQKQLILYRDQLKELEDKKKASASAAPGAVKWTTEDERKIEELKKKLANPPNRANPAISETVKVTVQIAPDAEPGDRDVRLETGQGLTNPRMFCIGQLPEFSRDPAEALRQRDPQKRVANRDRDGAFETRVQLPVIVNGQIMPGSEDHYRFFMHKGAQLVIAASARELIPYLPDAVPGWFQASITLTDAKGQELTYADHYTFHPDPVLHFTIPSDGDYCLSIRDSIYRGREDFVYRVSIGELPFITSVFPRGGRAGAGISLELAGWNLPSTNSSEDAASLKPGVYFHSVPKDKLISNRMPLAVDDLPECLSTVEGGGTNRVQAVSLPVVINGYIDKAGVWNGYHFQGRAGEEIVAEVMARRLDSPMDSVLRVTDASGRQLAFNDDFEDKGSGLNTHHADSRVSLKLPADGGYFVYIGDAQKNFGREYSYRLRLSQPRPDFELRVVPSSLNFRPGVTLPITVFALRKDGFSNDIDVVLKDAPPGFVLHGAWVPSGSDKVRMTVTAPSEALAGPASISLEGRGIIGGHSVVHPAVPAEDMMQAFIYRHLVPTHELAVASIGRAGGRKPFGCDTNSLVRLQPGHDATIHFNTPPRLAEKALIELSEPPDGVAVREIQPERGGTKVVLSCDAAKAKPGAKGNLIFNFYPDKANAGRPNQRPTPTLLPAVRFEIVTP